MANQTTAVERIEARGLRKRGQRPDCGRHAYPANRFSPWGHSECCCAGRAATSQGASVPIQLRPRPFPSILDRPRKRSGDSRARKWTVSRGFWAARNTGRPFFCAMWRTRLIPRFSKMVSFSGGPQRPAGGRRAGAVARFFRKRCSF